MGTLRTHLLFTDGEEIVHNAKLKQENYNTEDYEEMDLNELERQVIHEMRIAEEEMAERAWHRDMGGEDES